MLTPSANGAERAMSDQKQGPTGEEKRKLYIAAFCIAGGIEVFRYAFGAAPYKPTLIGLAIIIAAVLFFSYSWLTDR